MNIAGLPRRVESIWSVRDAARHGCYLRIAAVECRYRTAAIPKRSGKSHALAVSLAKAPTDSMLAEPARGVFSQRCLGVSPSKRLAYARRHFPHLHSNALWSPLIHKGG